jgi:ABC-type transporter Mla subunit MlaD
MKIEPIITTGNIIQIAAFLLSAGAIVAGFAGWRAQIEERQSHMAARVDRLEASRDQIARDANNTAVAVAELRSTLAATNATLAQVGHVLRDLERERRTRE